MVDVYTGDVPNLTQTQPEFDTNTQNILDYIAGIAPQLNDWVGAYVQDTTTVSSTEHTLGTGSKTFTVEAGKGYKEDMTVRASGGGGNFMDGNVTAYSGTSLTVNFANYSGSGTFDDWDIYLNISGGATLESNTFTGDQFVPNDDYDESTWNGNNSVPTKNAIRDKIQSVASTFVSASKSLVVTNNAATPNSIMDVTADEILLKNSSGVAFLASAVNVQVDIANTGAGGLDVPSEAISTNYYIHVIYNPTTSTVAGLISASPTSPTLPAGYPFSALVAWVYNDASSNFIKIRWRGNRYRINRAVLTTTLPSTSYVPISTVGLAPPEAKAVLLKGSHVSGGAVSTSVYYSPQSASDDLANLQRIISGSTTSYTDNESFWLDCLTANTFWFKRVGDALSGGGAIYFFGGEW